MKTQFSQNEITADVRFKAMIEMAKKRAALEEFANEADLMGLKKNQPSAMTPRFKAEAYMA